MPTGEHTVAEGQPDNAADRLRAATELLESVVADRGLLGLLSVEERTRLLSAAADVFNPDVVQRRRFTKAQRKQEKASRIGADESLLSETGIRALREKPVFTTPNVYPPKGFDLASSTPEARETLEEQHCYVCKQPYRELHPFYDQLCPPCAAFNFAKRSETADLRGKVALLTGGRVKIGYQAGIKLLRAGAHLIVTTRFPRDSAARYSREEDFADWGDRLQIYGLDLRHTPSVEAFCRHLSASTIHSTTSSTTPARPFAGPRTSTVTCSEPSLPPPARSHPRQNGSSGGYEGVRRYDMLRDGAPGLEKAGLVVSESPSSAAELTQVRLLPEEAADQGELFPEGRLDQDLQQATSATAIRGASCSTRYRGQPLNT